jgi:hypothetical protein
VHEVPAATDCTADHVPLAHCWKEVPPMQFHIPSVVHAPVNADPDPVVPVLAGAGVDVTGDSVGCDTAGLEATTAGAEVG